jgi:hypothetical protein
MQPVLEIDLPSGRGTFLPHTDNNTDDFKCVDKEVPSALTLFKFLITKGNVCNVRNRSDEESGCLD